MSMEPHSRFSDRENVKRIIHRLVEYLDPRSVELLRDLTFPSDATTLENLTIDACLIKLFNHLLKNTFELSFIFT
jgi:hypothetical protein